MSVVTDSSVHLQRSPREGWQLVRHGSAYTVCGAGGEDRPALLASLGGNTLRTWHTPDARVLDAAHAAGLAVMAGLAVGHERHGFDYTDPHRVERQRAGLLSLVRKFKNHPALLVWGLGNETEGFERPDGNPLVWQELDVLARLIKAEDPAHPVCTVIAGPGAAKLASFERFCPHVDILGVNAYGDAPGIPDALARAGIMRPYLLTEFGPAGHWEVRATPWGAPIEPSGHDKAANYLRTHREIMRRSAGHCLGSFAFLWGHKQEVTPTWYGMFLPSGEKTASVDAMTLAWTGREAASPCPRIESVRSSFIESRVEPGSCHEVHAAIVAGGDERLTLDWTVLAESSDRKIGGDPESVPPSWPDCVRVGEGGEATLTAPAQPGAYRLFLRVRDGAGSAAVANFPFLVG